MNRIRSIKDIHLKNLIKAHLKLRELKREKLRELSNRISSDFSYALGVVLGDGYITFPKKGGGYIGLNVKDKDFAEDFKNSLDKWSGKKCRLYFYEDCWRVYLHLVVAAKFLKNFDVNKLFFMSEEIKCAFLRGLFDSEGSVNIQQKRICFYNSNTDLINLAKILLDSLGINYIKIYKREGEIHTIEGREYLVKPVYSLVIRRRKNLELFYKKIRFSIKRKQSKLENILKSYQRNHIPWTKEEIKFLKHSLLLSLSNDSINTISKQIAERMGRAHQSVRRAIYRYDLIK